MGLDMYLTKEIYIGAEYEHRKITGNINIFTNEKPISVDLNKVSSIIERAGYWRKANAIHQWFVNNVQNGEDDCKRYYVSPEKMNKLLTKCKTVLKNSKLINGSIPTGYSFNAEGERVYSFEEGLIIEDSSVADELLPTANGLFFGDTGYNEYYIEDIKDTIEILENALRDETGDFYYESSW